MIAKKVMSLKNLKQSFILSGSISVLATAVGISISIPIAKENRRRLSNLSNEFSKQFLKFSQQLGMSGDSIKAEFGDYVLLKILPDGGKIFRKKGESKTIIIGGNSASSLDGAAAAKLIKVLNDARENLDNDKKTLADIMSPVLEQSKKTSAQIEELIKKYMDLGQNKEEAIKSARSEIRSLKAISKEEAANAIDETESKSVAKQTESALKNSSLNGQDEKFNKLISTPINWMTMYSKSYKLSSIGSSFRKKIQSRVIKNYSANADAIKTITDVIDEFSVAGDIPKISTVFNFYNSEAHRSGLTAYKISNAHETESRYIVLNSKKHSRSEDGLSYTSYASEAKVAENSFEDAKVFIGDTNSKSITEDEKNQVEQMQILAELAESVNNDVKTKAENKLVDGIKSSDKMPFNKISKEKALVIGSILNETRYKMQHKFFKGLLSEILDGSKEYDRVKLNEFADVIDKAVDEKIPTDGFFANLNNPKINEMIRGMQKVWNSMSFDQRKWLADNKLLLFLANDETNGGLKASGTDYTRYATKLFQDKENKSLLDKIKAHGGNISNDIKEFVKKDIISQGEFENGLKNIKKIAGGNKENFDWYVRHQGVLAKMINDNNMQDILNKNMQAIDELRVSNESLNEILEQKDYENKLNRFTRVNNSESKEFILKNKLTLYVTENDTKNITKIEDNYKNIEKVNLFNSKEIKNIFTDPKKQDYLKSIKIVSKIEWLIDKKVLLRQILENQKELKSRVEIFGNKTNQKALEKMNYDESRLTKIEKNNNFKDLVERIIKIGASSVSAWIQENALTEVVLAKLETTSSFIEVLANNKESMAKLKMSLADISEIIKDKDAVKLLNNSSLVAKSKYIDYYAEKDVANILIRSDKDWINALELNMQTIKEDLKFEHLQLKQLITNKDKKSLKHISEIQRSDYKNWLVKNQITSAILEKWNLFAFFKKIERRDSIDDLGLSPDEVFNLIANSTEAEIKEKVNNITKVNHIFNDKFTWLKKYSLVNFALKNPNAFKYLEKNKEIKIKSLERFLSEFEIKEQIKTLGTPEKIEELFKKMVDLKDISIQSWKWVKDNHLKNFIISKHSIASSVINDETVSAFKKVLENNTEQIKLIINEPDDIRKNKLDAIVEVSKMNSKEISKMKKFKLMEFSTDKNKIQIIKSVIKQDLIELYKEIWNDDINRVRNLILVDKKTRDTIVLGLKEAKRMKDELLERLAWLRNSPNETKTRLTLAVVGSGIDKSMIEKRSEWLSDKKYSSITDASKQNPGIIKILLINSLPKADVEYLATQFIKYEKLWRKNPAALRSIISIASPNADSELNKIIPNGTSASDYHNKVLKNIINIFKTKIDGEGDFIENVWNSISKSTKNIKNIFINNYVQNSDEEKFKKYIIKTMVIFRKIMTGIKSDENLIMYDHFWNVWNKIKFDQDVLEKILLLDEAVSSGYVKKISSHGESQETWVKTIQKILERKMDGDWIKFAEGYFKKGISSERLKNSINSIWKSALDEGPYKATDEKEFAISKIESLIINDKLNTFDLNAIAHFAWSISPDHSTSWQDAYKWFHKNFNDTWIHNNRNNLEIWMSWIERAKKIFGVKDLLKELPADLNNKLKKNPAVKEVFKTGSDKKNNLNILLDNGTSNTYWKNGFEQRIIWDLLSSKDSWDKYSKITGKDLWAKLSAQDKVLANKEIDSGRYIVRDSHTTEEAIKAYVAFSGLYSNLQTKYSGYLHKLTYISKIIFESGLIDLSTNNNGYVKSVDYGA